MLFTLAILASLLCSGLGLAQVKISKHDYHHATVGTTAADAIVVASVFKNLKKFTICHDAASANAYLSFSDGADPDADGRRLEPAQCFVCHGCTFAILRDLNVKGSAASTGYSLIQER